ncbi:MAG: class I SAM-dependent methyltransferase [Spirochaetota bacterium]|nr:class I SAM-dependent methyltransferase [Spirochaetota bacterium]
MDENKRKQMIEKTFDTVSDGYDNENLRFFPESAKWLASYLKCGGDEYVLDVCTGTGNMAIAIAEGLSEGRVEGVDLSEGMLEQAKKKCEERNLSNVSFNKMDLSKMDYPDKSFDAATCGFGIFFLTDIEKALSDITRPVKDGGKVAICCFREGTFSPLVDMFFKRVESYGIALPPMSWHRLDNESKCESIFQKEGLRDIEVHTRDQGYHLKDAQGWWEIIWNAGFRDLVNQLSDSDLQKFREEHMAEVQTLADDKGIPLNINIIYTLGIK